MCIEIPKVLLDENCAVGLVEEYLEKDGDGRFRYSGAYFERLGGGGDRPEVAYQVTAEDLLAVSMLSVRVIRYYALDVLVYRGREISGLLAQVPVDVRLADAGADKLIAEGGPAWELWKLLHDIKPPLDRSRLGPVYDSHVERVLGRTRTHGTWWSDLRCQLTKDAALVSELEAVRTRAGAGAAHLSLLRIFDIMCWMLGGDRRLSGPKHGRPVLGRECGLCF